jgi:cyclase
MSTKSHRISKDVYVIAILMATIFPGIVGTARAQSAQPQKNQPKENSDSVANRPVTSNSSDSEIHVVPVQGNVYMLVGAGANITVQSDQDGVLLVDTGLAQMSDKVVSAIRSISKKPIRFIIDTSADSDVVGGNGNIGQLGFTINPPVGAAGGGDADFEIKGAAIVSFQNVLDRMSDSKSKDLAPKEAWPIDTFTSNKKSLFFNNDRIQIIHQPSAHTDGDSIVIFHRADVISTGGIFSTTTYPIIDVNKGGSIQGIIEGLNHIIYEFSAAGEKEEGGTLVIPSHGRLCDQSDVVYFQEMVTIIRDRIRYMIKKGMTLEQVKQARPTQDYDPRYGATSGSWTTDMFVEAVYKDLTAVVSDKGKPEKQEDDPGATSGSTKP